MSQELYYTAPSQEVFDEVKNEVINIWNDYDDTFGYATDKINRIKNIQNIRDNFMYIMSMFDHVNIVKLRSSISSTDNMAIGERLN